MFFSKNKFGGIHTEKNKKQKQKCTCSLHVFICLIFGFVLGGFLFVFWCGFFVCVFWCFFFFFFFGSCVFTARDLCY